MRAWIALTIGVFVAAGPGLAEGASADPDLPSPTPKGQWLVLTPDDATSTSKCIGKPETPLCGAETILACFERKDKELCRVGMGRAPGDEYVTFGSKGVRGWKLYYQVVSATRMKGPDIPERLRNPGEFEVLPGNIRIVVKKKHCWIDGKREDCQTKWLTEIRYFLRRSDLGVWRLVEKYSPRRD